MILPVLFLERLKAILPPDFDVQAGFGPRLFRSFRVNTLKFSPEEAENFFKNQAIPYEWALAYGPALIVAAEAANQVLGSALAAEGKVLAQGLESMLAVRALDPQPGHAVLDLCAAPGVKTSQIAALMGNGGRLLANEPVRSRLYRLHALMKLMGAQAAVTSKDGRFFRSRELFDRILVDAPCSSEGRFRVGEPKTFGYWSTHKIHEMAHKQKGLLLNASRLLKPGGVLVYATCTFAPEENERVVEWLLKKTAGALKLQPLHFPGVPTYPGPLEGCLRVLPTARTEGFFLAKFSA